jgi:hypothetical protein
MPSASKFATTAVLLAALMLSGCSSLEFLYNRADWLAAEYVDSLADLSGEQWEDLSARLQVTLKWHREQELPGYIDLLGRIDAALDSELDAALVTKWIEEVDTKRRVAMRRLVGDVAPVFATLDAEQISHLEEALAERAADRIEEFANPDLERRKAARYERILERTEDWTGALDADQRVRLRTASNLFPTGVEVWAGFQAKNERALTTQLRAGADASAIANNLNGWMAGDAPRPTRLVENAKTWRTALIKLIMDVRAMLTPTQRAMVRDSLRGYIEDARSAHNS